MQYVTKLTCSSAFDFDVVDGKVTYTKFTMGCMGNTQGVASLVEGMEVEEVIKRLKGIDCGGRGTSCPDQLAKALEQYLEENK